MIYKTETIKDWYNEYNQDPYKLWPATKSWDDLQIWVESIFSGTLIGRIYGSDYVTIEMELPDNYEEILCDECYRPKANHESACSDTTDNDQKWIFKELPSI